MPLDEKVLVIPTERFRAAGYFHGLRAADDADRGALLDPAAFEFRPRTEVETDPSFKQLIPYLVLTCGPLVFHYRRGSTGAEKRLDARRSVGIGGHISAADAAGGADPYRTGMLRELAEEVALGCGFRERCVGFINDDRTPVGRVHLGVVHILELDAPAARSREDALADAGFAPWDELVRAADQFETWSQFVLACGLIRCTGCRSGQGGDSLPASRERQIRDRLTSFFRAPTLPARGGIAAQPARAAPPPHAPGVPQ